MKEVRRMLGFIEVEDNVGDKSFVNIDHVIMIAKAKNGNADVLLSNGNAFATKEDYNKLAERIARRYTAASIR